MRTLKGYFEPQNDPQIDPQKVQIVIADLNKAIQDPLLLGLWVLIDSYGLIRTLNFSLGTKWVLLDPNGSCRALMESKAQKGFFRASMESN